MRMPPLQANDISLAGAPLDASDEFEESDAPPRYCPSALLASFALLMAGHGRSVNTSMMLGDREYALWQLACARSLEDPELASMVARLFAYFAQARQHGGDLPGER